MAEVEATSSSAVAARPVGASNPPPRRRRRWRRRLLAAGLLALLLVIFHTPLLRTLGSGLIVDEPLEPADAVVIVGGDRALQEAAALYRAGFARQIVLTDDRSARVVRFGIIPPMESIARRELAERGVPDDAITTIVLPAPGAWEEARGLHSWLREHPGVRVTILAGQFESRRLARIVREVVGPEDAARVRWRALSDRRFDSSNWWRERQGIVTVASEYVALGFAVLKGENTEPSAAWDPDRYEQELRPAH